MADEGCVDVGLKGCVERIEYSIPTGATYAFRINYRFAN